MAQEGGWRRSKGLEILKRRKEDKEDDGKEDCSRQYVPMDGPKVHEEMMGCHLDSATLDSYGRRKTLCRSSKKTSKGWAS